MAQIVVAAAIGAVLYYFAILAAVHFEAKKAGMAPMPPSDIPAWREVAQDAHLVIPIAVLVWLMMERWSGNYAAFCATLAMVGVAALRRRTRMGWRQVLESAGQCRADHGAAGGLHRRRRHRRLGADRDRDGRGARRHHQGSGGGSFALLLVLLAMTVLVLGMGIPTTPSYIIAAAIGVPQMLDLGSAALGVSAAGTAAAGASVHLLLRGAGGCLAARRGGGLRGGGDRPAPRR